MIFILFIVKLIKLQGYLAYKDYLWGKNKKQNNNPTNQHRRGLHQRPQGEIGHERRRLEQNDAGQPWCTPQRVHDHGCPREASQRKKVLLPSRSGGVFPKENKRPRRGNPGTHRHVSFSFYVTLPLEASPGIPVLHVADSHRDCHPVWLSKFVHHGLSVPERIRNDPRHVSPSTPSAKLQRTICVVKRIWLYASVFHSLYFDTPSFF